MAFKIQTLEFVSDFSDTPMWQAWLADADSDIYPIGTGETEQEAIDDLLRCIENIK